MSCEHCCGADQLFDLRSAQKEIRSYKKKGPRKSTKKLLSLLSGYEQNGKSLLDIGGGIGAIQWEFVRNGGIKTTDIDASSSYISVAADYAKEIDHHTASFEMSDFNDVHEHIVKHDFVSLDKVICCYPDYKKLLGNALNKTGTALAMTMPIGGWISKLMIQFTNIYFFLRKTPFRSYIHSPKKVHTFIESNGFRLSEKTLSFPWLVRIYKRC
jgi:magnesium-protoporphyrin O-methyltransferase